MPNGRSGGFRITLTQFRQLLQGLPGRTQIGSLFGPGKAEGLTASDLMERLDRHGEKDVPVEEQNHSWYIAHLGADPKGWIAIEEVSPLYEGFRQCHADWLKRL